MEAEDRREELVGEFERSFGPILFALVVSLPLGLAFAALWGDFRLARTVAAGGAGRRVPSPAERGWRHRAGATTCCRSGRPFGPRCDLGAPRA